MIAEDITRASSVTEDLENTLKEVERESKPIKSTSNGLKVLIQEKERIIFCVVLTLIIVITAILSNLDKLN